MIKIKSPYLYHWKHCFSQWQLRSASKDNNYVRQGQTFINRGLDSHMIWDIIKNLKNKKLKFLLSVERMEMHINTFRMKWQGLLIMTFTEALYKNCCLGTSPPFFYRNNTNVEKPLLFWHCAIHQTLLSRKHYRHNSDINRDLEMASSNHGKISHRKYEENQAIICDNLARTQEHICFTK